MEKPIINLHIDTLIGKLVLINIPSDQNTSLDQFLKHSSEQVKSAVESVLLKALNEIDIDREISQKVDSDNKSQNLPH